MCESDTIIFVEPFYGGSHKQLIDSLRQHLPQSVLVPLSAKKWHWHARCGALLTYKLIPEVTTEKVLFCSSVLCLSELVGLRPDLNVLKKVMYFHENQLAYPVRKIKERDVQYAYNQITSCLVANVVLFNSHYNMQCFLDNISKIVKLIPDYKPKHLRDEIEPKCQVLYFPIDFKQITLKNREENDRNVLHIVWPHRWEFDKDPKTFFDVLKQLKRNKIKFRVSIVGEAFQDVPEVFGEAQKIFEEEILHFGFIESKDEYYDVLRRSDVVVSTAQHEFFGVSVLESVYCGCYPLLPNSLVYPEIYPQCCLYNGVDDLYQKLEELCLYPTLVREKGKNLQIDFSKYSLQYLLPKFKEILGF